MFVENQLTVKAERLRESFFKNTETLRSYISQEEYLGIEDFFVDSGLATVHAFFRSTDDSNPFGRDFAFYLNNSTILYSRYDADNTLPNEVQLTYICVSPNPTTGLLEYGTATLISENRLFSMDKDKLNALIRETFDNMEPVSNPDMLMDWNPHTRGFRAVSAVDVASLTLDLYLVDTFKKKGSRDGFSFDRQYINEIDAKIEKHKVLVNSEDDHEKKIKYQNELTKLRSQRHRTPSHQLEAFMRNKRKIGVYKQKLKSIFLLYKRAISQQDRKILSSFMQFNPYHANILAGYSSTGSNTDNEVKTRGMYRRQALERYPVFGKHLFSEYGQKSLSLIDEGSAPEKAFNVQGDFVTILDESVPEKKIKFFQSLKWQRLGTDIVHDKKHLNKLLSLLDPLNKDHLPVSRKGWYALNYLVKRFTSLPGHELFAKELIKSSFGRNKAYGNIDYYTNQRTKEEIERDLSGVIDFIENFSNKVIYPHVVRHHEGDNWNNDIPRQEDCYPIAAHLLSSLSLRQLIKMSDDWHSVTRMEELRHIMNLGRLKLPTEWPTIIEGDYEAPNGLCIVPLGTTQELIEEGKRMSHCVGTYADRCMYRGSNIVSIRDKAGRSLSTAEITFDAVMGIDENQPSYKMNLVQHRSKQNMVPTEDAIQALESFMTDIKKGRINISEEVIKREVNKEYNRSVNSIYSTIGFNPDNESGVGDMVLNYYSRYMKKSLQRLTYAEMGEEVVSLMSHVKVSQKDIKKARLEMQFGDVLDAENRPF